MFTKEKKNYFIIVGCNYGGQLAGCINDAKAMFNTFKQLPNSELHLITDEKEKVNQESIINIVNSVHEKEKNLNTPYQIFFTFAGHGHPGGSIQLSNGNVVCKELYEIFNSGSVRKFELIVVLDCCYAGGFDNLNKYGNIKNTLVITSCNSSQRSAESISNLRNNELEKKYDICKEKNYYIGVFTYNFTEIINWLIKNNKEIKLENIFIDSIWNTIAIIGKQSYQIKK
ncbi:Caspase domain [seawater metagenome]|uniref:Caspase domain n=1 Tax=seawater metagenome TaxID=1561972 RepID=A0A5E8CMG0_9ZZZZ